MSASFDDIIFLLSTDCFCSEILTPITESESLKIREAARAIIPQIINEGDNYYMCADFSNHRIRKTESIFFEAAKNSAIPDQTIQKIHALHEILKGNSNEKNTASYVISSIASRLYWLATDTFSTPVTQGLLELISEVEPLGLDTEHYSHEWREAWLESKSGWDKYIMSLMDGVDEAPYLTFTKLNSKESNFGFLHKWNCHLGREKFSLIRSFIINEAHHELDETNAPAAAAVVLLMNTI